MSSPISPPDSRSRPFNLQDESMLGAGEQGQNELAVRIEQQRAKIRALELAAGERRRADELRIQGQARRAETRGQRLHPQEQPCHKDRQVQDKSAMQGLLRFEAAGKAKRAREAEEFRLAKIKELEQKQALRDQQDQQRRIERQKRDEAAAQDILRRKAVAEARRAQDRENYRLMVEQLRLARQTERERKQLLYDQKDQQRRLDRQARDEACMQALLRHEAATKAKKAQELEQRKIEKLARKEQLAEEQKLARLRKRELAAEERKLARLREKEQKQSVYVQQDEQHRKERQRQNDPAILGRLTITRADIDERQAPRSSWNAGS
ncbi:hypothetical protein F5884DRAFT_890286 [Xylogone sp. PMI_703]|nr:hypothetical protein F5884DRAFT_890286 [Xylogone sp. PMI_703]